MTGWLVTALVSALLAGAVSCAVFWGATLLRVLAAAWTTPRLDRTPPSSPDEPLPSVCVLIPAHNEADEIPGLIRGLREQDHPVARFVLCCDRCTDGTPDAARAAIAGDPRFEVLEIGHCPEDWAGKVHALHEGVRRGEAARSSALLLFADADTRFAPGCVRAACTVLEARGLDALSLLPSMSTSAWFERLVQPAAGLELFYQYPLRRTNRHKTARPFFNGQFMLFRREAYEAVGGHEGVRDELLEDLAIARLLVRRGRRVGVAIAGGMVACRMYDSWAAFRNGWTRIYAEAGKRRVRRLRRAAARVRVVSVVLPAMAAGGILAGLLAGEGGLARACWIAGAAGVIAWLGALVAIYRLGRHPVWLAPMHPVGAWLVARLLDDAARDLRLGTPIRWGGRSYHRPQR